MRRFFFYFESSTIREFPRHLRGELWYYLSVSKIPWCLVEWKATLTNLSSFPQKPENNGCIRARCFFRRCNVLKIKPKLGAGRASQVKDNPTSQNHWIHLMHPLIYLKILLIKYIKIFRFLVGDYFVQLLYINKTIPMLAFALHTNPLQTSRLT